MKLGKLGFVLILMIFISGAISAEEMKHKRMELETSTVQSVIDNAEKLDRDDAVVKLHGKILSKINREEYYFEDSTGKMIVEFDKDDDWDIQFDQMVIIIGEIDADRDQPIEFDVDKLRPVNP